MECVLKPSAETENEEPFLVESLPQVIASTGTHESTQNVEASLQNLKPCKRSSFLTHCLFIGAHTTQES